MTQLAQPESVRPETPESAYAWFRLGISLLLGTVGSVGMWSVVVVLPTVQADFAVARAEASLPYTLAMIGFGVGGIAMGRLADRLGIVAPVFLGACCLAAGYVSAGLSPNLWVFALAHALIGFGASATFGPLMADVSYWFTRRRGIAIAISSSGNYLAGAVWPPLLQHFVSSAGWRPTHIGIGIFCICAMLPLMLVLRRRPPAQEAAAGAFTAGSKGALLGISPNTLQILLCIAGVACCVAMSMPQVHIVAYCNDLGYGVARGAEMLSVMLGLGIVSRIASGFIADKIGGVATLLIGSMLQGVALFLYLWFDGLTSLFVISALFGLFQGGIVPMYAIIVREYFSPQEAGTRVGIVLMATLVGMAFGGWVSGLIFDLTGSYQAAFAHGLLWNFLNVAIAVWLLLRPGRLRFATA
ncbi:MAG TPA: MFS transporter [Xanthobacteraceae bacterium]|nr:MFS transporter [Xanthobacteraceae bacterium]